MNDLMNNKLNNFYYDVLNKDIIDYRLIAGNYRYLSSLHFDLATNRVIINYIWAYAMSDVLIET